MTDYIEIRNWDRFQHADATKRGRDPVWIKTYTRILSDDAYLNLSGHRRAILHGLWLEYARSGRRLPLDTRSITRRIDLRVTMRDLEAIIAAGFVELVSTPRSHRGLTVVSTASPTHDDATTQDTTTKTQDASAIRQDTVKTPSIQEEKREEKTRAVTYLEDHRAKNEAQGPGENDFTDLLKEMPA